MSNCAGHTTGHMLSVLSKDHANIGVTAYADKGLSWCSRRMSTRSACGRFQPEQPFSLPRAGLRPVGGGR